MHYTLNTIGQVNEAINCNLFTVEDTVYCVETGGLIDCRELLSERVWEAGFSDVTNYRIELKEVDEYHWGIRVFMGYRSGDVNRFKEKKIHADTNAGLITMDTICLDDDVTWCEVKPFVIGCEQKVTIVMPDGEVKHTRTHRSLENENYGMRVVTELVEVSGKRKGEAVITLSAEIETYMGRLYDRRSELFDRVNMVKMGGYEDANFVL